MWAATGSVLKSQESEETVRGSCKGNVIKILHISSENSSHNFQKTKNEIPSSNLLPSATEEARKKFKKENGSIYKTINKKLYSSRWKFTVDEKK